MSNDINRSDIPRYNTKSALTGRRGENQCQLQINQTIRNLEEMVFTNLHMSQSIIEETTKRKINRKNSKMSNWILTPCPPF